MLIANAMKTILGICDLYGVGWYICVDDARIAVYNVPNDNFHIFRWSDLSRYVLCGIEDTIPNWLDNKVKV